MESVLMKNGSFIHINGHNSSLFEFMYVHLQIIKSIYFCWLSFEKENA